MKTITIHTEEAEPKEGLFLVNPVWVHLDEKEVQEKLQIGEKVFKINFEEIK
jgi:hypothetical protein